MKYRVIFRCNVLRLDLVWMEFYGIITISYIYFAQWVITIIHMMIWLHVSNERVLVNGLCHNFNKNTQTLSYRLPFPYRYVFISTSQQCAHGSRFVKFCSRLEPIDLPELFGMSSVTLGQLCDCLSVSDVILKNMGSFSWESSDNRWYNHIKIKQVSIRNNVHMFWDTLYVIKP